MGAPARRRCPTGGRCCGPRPGPPAGRGWWRRPTGGSAPCRPSAPGWPARPGGWPSPGCGTTRWPRWHGRDGRWSAPPPPRRPSPLVGVGARATGLPIGPPDRSEALVARVEGLVRDGGPAYVKLGQFIATARGLLPDDWVDAFGWCRDQVPPMRPGKAEGIVERAFDLPIDVLFRLVRPRAAGVGLDRPGARRRPRRRHRGRGQGAAAAAAARGSTRPSRPWRSSPPRPTGASSGPRIANLPGVVELFAELVLEELDFRFEALNMVELGLVTEDAGLAEVRIPRPIPGLVDPRVRGHGAGAGPALHRGRRRLRPGARRRAAAAPGHPGRARARARLRDLPRRPARRERAGRRAPAVLAGRLRHLRAGRRRAAAGRWCA